MHCCLKVSLIPRAYKMGLNKTADRIKKHLPLRFSPIMIASIATIPMTSVITTAGEEGKQW